MDAMTRIRPSCICALLAPVLASCGSAYAQAPAGGIDLGARRGIAPDALSRTPPAQDRADSPFEFSARAGIATDYVYRGVTLSARQPAAGAAFELARGMFYGGASVASVRLPSQPGAEVTVSGGVRPKLGDVQFDFGASYFAYPGEAPPPGVTAGINYWEAVARADTTLGELLRVAGGFAYAPNVSNTGAWGTYAAFGLGLDLPGTLMPQDISASVTGGAGYSWFGNQSAALGGFPLPAYLNWNAGVTFTYKKLNLDLRYYDTNLSKENCFVFTGDPNAAPGGRPNPITNPAGLVSQWCSAAFVAKYFIAFD
jgi:uncharacterized protein (TIGR02001 family)